MGFTEQQTAKLDAPLAPSRVKQRQGAGSKTFDHIEGWDAIRQANEVFGFDGWSRTTVELREVWAGTKPGYQGKPDKQAVAYIARVKVTVFAGDRIIEREGVGFGNGDGPNLGDAHELACKEAETDATKRALSTFGWGFGLALYDKSKEHVREEESETPKREEPARKAAKNEAPPADARKAPEAPARQPVAEAKGALPLPKDRSEDGWRVWSRPLMASVKASESRADALAIIEANSRALSLASEDTGKDVRKVIVAMVEKRWPQEDAEQPGQDTQESTAAVHPRFIVALPKTRTPKDFAAWGDKLADLLIREAEDLSELDLILEANKEGALAASAALKTDVSERLRGMWQEAQKSKRKSR